MKPILLPAYLEQNDLWVHLAEVVANVTQEPIEKINRYISWLRDQYITDEAANAKIEQQLMLSQDDFSSWDRETTIGHVSLQGFTFKNAEVLSSDDYVRLYRNLPLYWYKQGTENFIDFFSFALNTPFVLRNMWTQDYVTFLEEGDPGIGTPIYQGGTWYPTTHVTLEYDGLKYANFTHTEIVSFFYYFANYNLVLKFLTSRIDLPIQDLGLTSAFGRTVVWNIEMTGVLSDQTISYLENKAVNAVIGAMSVSDSYTAFRFTATGTGTSSDGFFTVDSTGTFRVTAAGAASTANNFEAGPNSIAHQVEAQQAITGTWVGPVTVTFAKLDADEVLPVITASQVFNMVENQAVGYQIGTVAATDNVGVTGFRFAATSTNTSSDGFFQINDAGLLTLTATGAAGAPNDFETLPNSFTPSIQARDAAGNWSAGVVVTINTTNADDVAPVVTAGQTITYAERQAAGAVVGTITATDDVGVTGWRFAANQGSIAPDSRFSITSSGQVVITPIGVVSAANDFETLPNSFTYAVQARDAAGNWSAAENITLNVTDVAPTVAAGQSFSYQENLAAGAAIGTVQVTDNGGFRFAATATDISQDGYYQISSTGVISLTAAGAGSARNDFESATLLGTVTMTYAIQVRDTVANWSPAVNVTLTVTNSATDDNVIAGLGVDLGQNLGGPQPGLGLLLGKHLGGAPA